MSDFSNLLFSFISGFSLGCIFFCGLWFTVTKMINSRYPVFLVFISGILRLGITTLGFYSVTALDNEGKLVRLATSLVGFLIARIMVTKMIKVKTCEVGHEP